MKPLFTFVAFCMLLVLGYSADEKFSETHPFAADGEVILSNVNGDVTFRTWDRAEIKIEGEKHAKTDEELKLIGLTIDANPTVVTIKTKFPKRSAGFFGGETIRARVTFTLTLPTNARLRKVETVNGGIAIDGVGGTVNAESVNGRITASGLRADATLKTVNGPIHATFAGVARGQKISVRTVNGPSTISLPKDVSLKLDAETVNGGIDCDFPIQLDGTRGRRQLRGTIGGGDATLKAETVNGGIRVKQL